MKICVSGILEFDSDVLCKGPFTVIVSNTLVDILHPKFLVLWFLGNIISLILSSSLVSFLELLLIEGWTS